MSVHAEQVATWRAARSRLMGAPSKQAPKATPAPPPPAPAPKRKLLPEARIMWVSSPRPEVTRLQVRHIQQAVAEAYGVKLADILGPCRLGRIVLPRQIAMYLAKQLLGISQPELGRRFGGRDHTTVLHSVRKIGFMADCDDAVKAHLGELIAILRQKFPLAFGERVA